MRLGEKNERALSGQRSEAAHFLRVLPRTLPKGVRSLCALKKPTLLSDMILRRLFAAELQTAEKSKFESDSVTDPLFYVG